ncbi:AAA family ATPase [Aliarcobacter butzleri]|uniref:AAA family ATPase n=1 Tax=Aliarcobacter butzleri TaxID=28197 RepID=UPI003ACE3871
MELVYLWVEKHKNIYKQGFNFSPRFECKFFPKYDKDGKLEDNCELKITPKDYVNIFPDNINITAIVGENGSGKTNTIEAIISLLDTIKNTTKYEKEKLFLVYFFDNKYFVKGSKNTFEHDSNVGKFKNETCISPNDEKFYFHQKVKFKLFLDNSCKNLHIKSKDDIDITLKEQFSDIYDKYIDIFKLNERYKAHKDIVFDMIQKAELYPQSRLKELENLTGIPFQQIKKDIFNLIDESEDLSKQPFSKLIVDMSKELGII